MNTVSVTSSITSPRGVERLVKGLPTSDGAGVKLTRVLTQDLQRRLDPYLMLDAFGSDTPGDSIAGFPNHPHRGFHSELPEQEEGVMEGFQLWLNLPAADKMRDPWYRDFSNAEVPEFTAEGVTARVIAGSSHGVTGAVQRDGTEPLYLDLHLEPGAVFEQPLLPGHNAFIYVYRGAASIGSTEVPQQRMAILANTPGSDGVRLQAGDAATRLLLIAGKPLNEPIVQHGPFVMNSKEQIYQAVADFQAGRFA
jgi:redox-sensitive bicupin YhaK (pirin superfamily)